MQIIITLWLLSAMASMSQQALQDFRILNDINNSSDYLLWKRNALPYLCTFNASVFYFYFERQISENFANGLLKGISHCGTGQIILKNRQDYNVSIVNDDGILMYMALVIANTKKSIYLRHIRKDSGEKHKSIFIVLIEDALEITDDWLKTSFRTFWDLWILNVIIIFWKEKLNVYTYSPFSREFLKKLPTTAHRKDDIFSPKIPNMYGYPLRISMYPEEIRAIFNKNKQPDHGVDVFVMNLVVEAFNARRIIVKSKDLGPGEIYKDGTGYGSIGLVITNDADVSFNARFLVPYLFEGVLENTVVIGRDDLCILVPRTGRPLHLLRQLKPFKKSVWIMIFVIFLGVYGLLKILLPQETNIFLSLFSLSLNLPISRFPKNDTFRLFLIFWLFYTILITGAYQGNLTSYVAVPLSRRLLNTVEQIAEAGYEVLLDEMYADYITNVRNYSLDEYELLSNVIKLVPTDVFQSHLRTNNISYGYMDKWHLQFHRLNNKRHMHSGRIIYHLARSCPIPFHIAYVVPQGSPYLGYINKIIRYADEHGLFLYWYDYMATLRKILNMRGKNPDNRDKPRVMKLRHIQTAFILLGCGLGISIIVFLIERYWISLKDKIIRCIFAYYEFVN